MYLLVYPCLDPAVETAQSSAPVKKYVNCQLPHIVFKAVANITLPELAKQCQTVITIYSVKKILFL